MTDKVKPCPFCGSEAQRKNVIIARLHVVRCSDCGCATAIKDTCKDLEDCENFERCGDAGYYSTVCTVNNGGCGSSSGYARSKGEAIAAWNRRARLEDENGR